MAAQITNFNNKQNFFLCGDKWKENLKRKIKIVGKEILNQQNYEVYKTEVLQ